MRGYLVDAKKKTEFNDGRIVDRGYLAGTANAVTNARAFDISNRYPAGGFVSSGEDLLRLVIKVGTGKILGRESLREMWTVQRAPEPEAVFGLGWGCLDGKTR